MFLRSAIILVAIFLAYRFYLERQPVTLEKILNHKARQFDSWTEWRSEPLVNRVQAAPTFLIDYLRKDNEWTGWKERPKVVRIDVALKADLKRAIEGIPEEIHRLLAHKLVGIFVVKDLGGSAYAENLFDKKKEEVGGFIVLDIEALNRLGNEWATWKENSPFRTNRSDRLIAKIADVDSDDRAAAFQYILLHEMAHILGFGRQGPHPFWDRQKKAFETADNTFFNFSWFVEGKGFASKHDYLFAERKNIRYYALKERQLAPEMMLKAYEFLEKTDFPTLYAATNPRDDWAESFANFVHVEMLKKPFEIKVLEQGAVVKTYGDCWSEKRCAKKRAFIENFINNQEGDK